MKLLKKIKQRYQRWQRRMRFYAAKREANQRHQTNGRRYYVIPNAGKLLVVNSDFVKLWNKNAAKFGVKKIDGAWLMRECLYYTPEDSKTGKPKTK